jgi:hypothetical protein
MGNGLVCRDFFKRQGVDVSQVHCNVDGAHRKNAEHHGEWNVPSRIFNFPRYPRDVNPTVIGPEDRDQSNAQCGNQLSRTEPHGQSCSMGLEVGPMTLADEESQDDETGHCAEFCPG